jgi:hypothetical protein
MKFINHHHKLSIKMRGKNLVVSLEVPIIKIKKGRKFHEPLR